MASKTILLLALALATFLLITSEIAARDLTSNHDTSEVEDTKYHVDQNNGGYFNGGGRGGYYNGGGRGGGYYNGGGRGGYYNGGGRGGYYNGGGRGGYYNGGGRHGGGYCMHGCCGRYYNGGCRCCSTNVEATAYKQAHEAQTHN